MIVSPLFLIFTSLSIWRPVWATSSLSAVKLIPSHDLGQTALQAAVEEQHVDVVEMLLMLLQNGANVNGVLMRYKGMTALQAVSAIGNLELAERLLAAGADMITDGSYYNG